MPFLWFVLFKIPIYMQNKKIKNIRQWIASVIFLFDYNFQYFRSRIQHFFKRVTIESKKTTEQQRTISSQKLWQE